MSTALILFSGGQDSTTCLALAKSRHDTVHAICFDYGQRHRIELTQAQQLATLTNTPLTIIPVPFLSELTNNALTNHHQSIEHQPNQLPSTFVPGRNHLFLSFMAIIAYQKQINTIYTGVCQTDYAGYPDCRSEFITSLTTTLRLAMDYPFDIQTPLMHKTKAQTIQLMIQLGHLDWYAHTHTCYKGKRPACGTCPACHLRLAGFKEAGIRDPLPYS